MDTPHNRPQKGESIKVEPIRQKAAIERIKAVLLKNAQYRDHCLFTLGINTAFRANELLSLKIGQVLHLAAGDILELKQSKNRKHRAVPLNKTAAEALRLYIERDRPCNGAWRIRTRPCSTHRAAIAWQQSCLSYISLAL
jgi:integrase